MRPKAPTGRSLSPETRLGMQPLLSAKNPIQVNIFEMCPQGQTCKTISQSACIISYSLLLILNTLKLFLDTLRLSRGAFGFNRLFILCFCACEHASLAFRVGKRNAQEFFRATDVLDQKPQHRASKPALNSHCIQSH